MPKKAKFVLSEPLPHIILIIMDTASAKRSSLYGHFRETTPNLERLAPEMMVYRNCFTPAAWTIPSHISLFTGLYPGEHGCNGHDSVLPEEFLVLPEILRGLGYRTVTISNNLLVSRAFQFQRGYDEFYQMEDLFNSRRFHEASDAFEAFKRGHKSDLDRLAFLWRYCHKNKYYSFPLHKSINKYYRNYLRRSKSSSHSTERTLRLTHKILAQHPPSQPLFLFINFMETHDPYNPPQKYNNIIKISKRRKQELLKLGVTDFFVGPNRGFTPEVIETKRLLYDQEMAYLDDRLADLYAFLERQGMLDNTLLVITADHGECLGEHGLWGHAYGLYNELVHIPLMVKYPARYSRRGESTNIVQLHDLFATIGEITDIPYPVPDSSQSLLGPPREFALAERCCLHVDPDRYRQITPDYEPLETMQTCCAIIDQELRKLILWADGRGELYDLKKDYAEENNLIHHPDYQNLAQDLKQKLLALTACPPGEERI